MRDLALPTGVVTDLPGDEIIAAVSEPRSEEELNADLSTEVTTKDPEVLTEKKKEEGEGAEAINSGKEAESKKE